MPQTPTATHRGPEAKVERSLLKPTEAPYYSQLHTRQGPACSAQPDPKRQTRLASTTSDAGPPTC